MIVIDAAKGGSEKGVSGNGIIEKDLNLLISKYIYDRLKELGAEVTLIREVDETLSDIERSNRIKDAYGNNSKVIAVSNMLSSGGGEGAEIIYALRNNDNLASLIASNLIDSGIIVDKWYQRRNLTDTAKDYYDIQNNTGQIQTIIINYGYVDNENDAKNLKNNYKKYAEAVVKSLASYSGIPYSYKDNSVSSYVVQKGDSLYSIANKNGISVDEIKKLNNLTSNLLSIGQILYLPSKNQNINNEIKSTYVVQKGDSLYSIAKRFNTTVDEIKRLNNLTSNLLSIGQLLIILEEIPNNVNQTVYIVKKGDNLYSIANKYNISVNDLISYNNLTNNLLSIGQELKIPSQNIYIVQKGDSLYLIANKNNTTVNEIKKKNNLTSNLINVGQQLLI